MDMEMLIQTVQDYPALYDPSHPDYGKKRVNDSLWDKIADELNYSNGVVVKDHWTRLRNRHRNALRKEKKKLALGQKRSPPWIYQSEMEFLLPFMTKSLNSNSADSREDNASDDNTNQTDDISTENGQEDEEIEFTHPEFDSSFPFEPMKSTQPEIERTFSLHPPKRRKYEISESAFETADQKPVNVDELLQELIAFKTQKMEETNDPLFQFFMSMYQTTKGLPNKYQLRVRKKLFYSVSDAEEEILAADSNQVSNPHLSSSNSEAVATGDRKNSVK